MESAVSIAKLLERHEAYYPLRRMNVQAVGIVCSAALLLTFANLTRCFKGETDPTEQQLSACFRALEEMSPSWENAKRSRDFLLLLRRQWEQARPPRTLDLAEDGPRKRARTVDAQNLHSEDPFDQMPFPSQQVGMMTGILEDFLGPEPGLDFDWVASDMFPASQGRFE